MSAGGLPSVYTLDNGSASRNFQKRYTIVSNDEFTALLYSELTLV